MLIFRLFFYLTVLIVGSHIVFNSILGLLNRLIIITFFFFLFTQIICWLRYSNENWDNRYSCAGKQGWFFFIHALILLRGYVLCVTCLRHSVESFLTICFEFAPHSSHLTHVQGRPAGSYLLCFALLYSNFGKSSSVSSVFKRTRYITFAHSCIFPYSAN